MLSPKNLDFLNRLNRHTLVDLAAVSARKKAIGHVHSHFTIKQDFETVNNLLRELEVPVWCDFSREKKPKSLQQVVRVKWLLRVSRDQLEEMEKCISFPFVKKLKGENEAYFRISSEELAATKEGKLVNLDEPLYLSDDEKFLGKPFITDPVATSFYALAYACGTRSLNKVEATIVNGLAHGYPRCCAEAAAHNRFIDALSIIDGPTELLFIVHGPCGLECEESLELGRAYMEAVRDKLHPKFVDKIILEKKRFYKDFRKSVEILAQFYLKEAFTPNKAIKIDKAHPYARVLKSHHFTFSETIDGKFYLSEFGKREAHERFERGFYPFSCN